MIFAHRRRTWISFTVAALLAVPAGNGSRAAAPGDSAYRPRNVLFISIDTLRADHLSCYGYPLRTSPRIDELARDGVLFTRASSVVPLTGPSHATMMTGLVPRDHGAVRNGVPMREDVVTLAGRLTEAGFRTAAFISGWTLRAPLTGLDRGFSVYDDEMTDRYQVVNNQRRGDETTARALAWLADHDTAPFFLWLHLFDPHDPYDNHGLELSPVDGASAPRRNKKLTNYDQEILFADTQIGKILAHLERSNLLDRTLVVLTSDHGESFGEHGESGHGRHLYQTTQHVPLVLRHPSVGGGRISDVLVSLQDLFPTILDLVGVPQPTAAGGVRLHEAIHSPQSLAGREIFMETFHGARRKFWRIFGPKLTGEPIRVALRRGDWKVILDPRSETTQLYDLGSDPAERKDLAGVQEYRVRQVLPRLTAYADKEWKAASSPDRLTDEDRQRLESLGYAD